jgi:hypothetical protein
VIAVMTVLNVGRCDQFQVCAAARFACDPTNSWTKSWEAQLNLVPRGRLLLLLRVIEAEFCTEIYGKNVLLFLISSSVRRMREKCVVVHLIVHTLL